MRLAHRTLQRHVALVWLLTTIGGIADRAIAQPVLVKTAPIKVETKAKRNPLKLTPLLIAPAKTIPTKLRGTAQIAPAESMTKPKFPLVAPAEAIPTQPEGTAA